MVIDILMIHTLQGHVSAPLTRLVGLQTSPVLFIGTTRRNSIYSFDVYVMLKMTLIYFIVPNFKIHIPSGIVKYIFGIL